MCVPAIQCMQKIVTYSKTSLSGTLQDGPIGDPHSDVVLYILAHVYVHISANRCVLALKVLVTTIDAQWEGMGDVG